MRTFLAITDHMVLLRRLNTLKTAMGPTSSQLQLYSFPLSGASSPRNSYSSHRQVTRKKSSYISLLSEATMISAKKLIKMARKWQKMAALRRRRIPLPTASANSGSSSFIADKGHFIVYTTDRKRFMIPLEYLYSDLFQELFKMSEDEFGLSGSGPITVPCDAASMEYMISLVQRGLGKDLEKALLNIVASTRCSLAVPVDQTCISRQVFVCVH